MNNQTMNNLILFFFSYSFLKVMKTLEFDVQFRVGAIIKTFAEIKANLTCGFSTAVSAAVSATGASMGTGDKLSTFILAYISGSIDKGRGNMVGVNGGVVVDRSVVGVDRGSHMMVEGVCINHRCPRFSSLLFLGMRNGK